MSPKRTKIHQNTLKKTILEPKQGNISHFKKAKGQAVGKVLPLHTRFVSYLEIDFKQGRRVIFNTSLCTKGFSFIKTEKVSIDSGFK